MEGTNFLTHSFMLSTTKNAFNKIATILLGPNIGLQGYKNEYEGVLLSG